MYVVCNKCVYCILNKYNVNFIMYNVPNNVIS